MKVGYAILYQDGELVLSKEHKVLNKSILADYGEFEDNNIPWMFDTSEIKIIRIYDKIKSNNMSHWFSDCSYLNKIIDFQNLDVSNCTNFSYIFYRCESLKDITALKNWNVSNGTNFSYMFYCCE